MNFNFPLLFYCLVNSFFLCDFFHLLFPTFDPPSFVATMKPSEVSGHWCLVVLNLKFHRFECLDSLLMKTGVMQLDY